MKINALISKTALLFILINLWSCTSTVEYTSAKMAIQDENWEEAEQYLLDKFSDKTWILSFAPVYSSDFLLNTTCYDVGLVLYIFVLYL